MDVEWNLISLQAVYDVPLLTSALQKFWQLSLLRESARKVKAALEAMATQFPPNAHQLYLLSSADEIIPAHHILSAAKKQEELGRSVHVHDFGDAPHVALMKMHPQLYAELIRQFLQRVQARPEN